nr:conserved phage C-terminal domain-containing protein [Siminovitchia terrae]
MNPFVQIDKTMLSDEKISWKAKGILSYLLSKPDGWITYITDIEKRSADGRDSVRSGIKELADAGYIIRKRIRDKGQFKGWEYEVYETPDVGKTENGKADVGKSDFGKTDVGESNTSNNDSSNNDLSNKEDSNNDNNIPYVEIVTYLNQAASKKYRHTTPKTKSIIKARWNEGFRLDDFKAVIDIKCKEWLSDEKMNKFLRPETLFGTKFESYLNQKGGATSGKANDSGNIAEEYNIPF